MKLDTIEQISGNFAKSLVNKHIHFTCHNREDNTIETMPGKVLNYNNRILEIDAMDIMYDDQSNSESNRLIKKISIDDISDVLVFDKYTKEFWNILDSIDEELKSKRFEISDVFGNTFITKILDNDSLSITILCDDEPYDYPLYFISGLKAID